MKKYIAFKRVCFSFIKAVVTFAIFIEIYTDFGMNIAFIDDGNDFNVWNIKIIIYDMECIYWMTNHQENR